MNSTQLANGFYLAWARGTTLYGRWATEHNLSYTELSVLYTLVKMGPTSQKTICDCYGLPKQTVNNCIREYIKLNYVRLEANENDKRVKKVILTKIGENFSQILLAPLFRIEEYICRNINSDKLAQAIETRELFNTIFEKEMEKEEQ